MCGRGGRLYRPKLVLLYMWAVIQPQGGCGSSGSREVGGQLAYYHPGLFLTLQDGGLCGWVHIAGGETALQGPTTVPQQAQALPVGALLSSLLTLAVRNLVAQKACLMKIKNVVLLLVPCRRQLPGALPAARGDGPHAGHTARAG